MSHYVPFITFLLTYGVRLGEAIAVRWSRVDFQHRIIVIDSALGRDLERSINATAKVLRPTKTCDVRYLPMTDDIEAMLHYLMQSNRKVTPESFVFEGHIGRYIDTRNFRLVWKTVLERLGIPYRYPYQCRHTVLSHVASEHGLAAAASLAGHKSLDMASRHYIKFTGSLSDVIPTYLKTQQD
jgi:integrase